MQFDVRHNIWYSDKLFLTQLIMVSFVTINVVKKYYRYMRPCMFILYKYKENK